MAQGAKLMSEGLESKGKSPQSICGGICCSSTMENGLTFNSHRSMHSSSQINVFKYLRSNFMLNATASKLKSL